MKLFNLAKTDKEGCVANRCKETDVIEVDGTFWRKEKVKLCSRHVDLYIAFAEANPDYKPAEPEGPPAGEPAQASMNQELLQVKVEPFQQEGVEIIELFSGYSIKSQEDMEQISEIIANIKVKAGELERLEKEITGPLTTVLTRVRAIFRPARQKLKDAEVRLKSLISAAKIKEEATNREAMRLAAQSHKAGDAEGVVTALSKSVSTGSVKGVSTISKWKFVIVDETLIPREFLMPNEKLIKEHCSHSTDREPTPIPGVEFVPDVTVSVTASKVLS